MDSKPHVLIIVQNLPVPFDRRVWMEAVSLRTAGFKVTVICPKKNIYREGFEIIDGVEIHRYSMLHDADRATLGFLVEFASCWLATAWLAAKVYLRHTFQAIHGCNPPDTYFALALLFKPLGVKFIFDHHDLCPEMYVAKGNPQKGLLYRTLLWLERLTLRNADAIIAVNESHREIALTRGLIKADKITVVRSGPRLSWAKQDAVQPSLKQGRKYLVVYLGEMGHQDGVDHLLSTIRFYADNFTKDVLFVLIGGGPEQQRLKQMATQLSLDEWVVFTGRITRDEVLWQYLATADLCIAPDPYTAYGNLSTTNKIIEYLAFGKPVVAFNLVEHRRTAQDAAMYVEPNNDKALAIATHDLLEDEKRRSIMGLIGQQRFRSYLAWENSEAKLIALYRNLLLPESVPLTFPKTNLPEQVSVDTRPRRYTESNVCKFPRINSSE